MKTFKSPLIVGLLMSGLVLAGGAYAGQDSKPCPDHPPMHKFGPEQGGRAMGHMMKELNLTEAQQAQLKTQREAQEQNRKARFEKMKTAREALHQAVESGASDAKLKSLAADIGKLESENALDMAKSQQAFMAILTPEQKQKMEKMRAEHQQKMQERMEQRAKAPMDKMPMDHMSTDTMPKDK